MADTVTTQTILDGPKNVVMKFTNESDGTGEADVTKVDVSTLAAEPSTGKPCSDVSIERIDCSCQGMGVSIKWDATTDVLFMDLQSGTIGTLYFDEYGGQTNPKASGYTGDIKFSTLTAASGATYSILLVMRKHYS